jgi:hypothetical protein
VIQSTVTAVDVEALSSGSTLPGGSVQRGPASGMFRAGQLNLGVPAGHSEEGINRFQARVATMLGSFFGARAA